MSKLISKIKRREKEESRALICITYYVRTIELDTANLCSTATLFIQTILCLIRVKQKNQTFVIFIFYNYYWRTQIYYSILNNSFKLLKRGIFNFLISNSKIMNLLTPLKNEKISDPKPGFRQTSLISSLPILIRTWPCYRNTFNIALKPV